MLPLTKEELKLLRDSKKVLHFCKKKSYKSLLKVRITKKLEIIAIIQVNVNIEAQHIVFVIQILKHSMKSQ